MKTLLERLRARRRVKREPAKTLVFPPIEVAAASDDTVRQWILTGKI